MEQKRTYARRRNVEKARFEIDAENISEDRPYVIRFFAAVFDLIAEEKVQDFYNFCKENSLNDANMKRIITNPNANVKVEHIAILVNKYGYSANWLITGKGKMK